jgi:hypothetical protein
MACNPLIGVPRQAGCSRCSAGVTTCEPAFVVQLPANRTLTLSFGKFKSEPVDLLLAHPDYVLSLLTTKAAMLICMAHVAVNRGRQRRSFTDRALLRSKD